MKSIHENLFIGNIDDYHNINLKDWAVVNATQSVHYTIMGWDRKYNKPPKDHPNYIKFIKDNRFSLNWVDGGSHLYDWTGVATFNEILDFIDKWIVKGQVLIHCDQGVSRSPTLGLLYLAKRAETIPNGSFQEAYKDFIKIYPIYSPSGIAEYVSANWEKLK